MCLYFMFFEEVVMLWFDVIFRGFFFVCWIFGVIFGEEEEDRSSSFLGIVESDLCGFCLVGNVLVFEGVGFVIVVWLFGVF